MNHSMLLPLLLLVPGSETLVLNELDPSLPALPQEKEAPGDFWEALAGGKASLNFRYRLEYGDVDAFDEESLASTLRTSLAYRTGNWEGFEGFLEFEDVTLLGDENYNSLVNGNPDHTPIVDPVGTGVNQAYVRMTGVENLDAKVGRQEIVHDNARFIGNVVWRQNHQSYDAARLEYVVNDDLTLDYAYLDNVSRIFGEDSPNADEDMASHLFHVRADLQEVGDLSAYAYLLDFDDSTNISSSTIGARLTGAQGLSDDFDLIYTAEYANQKDYATNDIDLDEDYYLAELGGRHEKGTLLVGFEHLGGSGNMGEKFSTPLATLHKFNGFADVFLITPDEGLDDMYISLRGKIGRVKCLATYHEFTSDTDSIDYGSEIDLDFVMPIREGVSVNLRFASFDADERYSDTTRAILNLHIRAL